MIDTQKLRDLIRQAGPLPWILATSNSWRRIVDFRHDPVCSPCNQPDGHPDLAFPGGVEGPTAQLLVEGINALPKLLDEIERMRVNVEAMTILVGSTALALVRHGIEDADDPGEAIDVLVAGKVAQIERLRAALEELIGWQTTAPEHVVEAARKALEESR